MTTARHTPTRPAIPLDELNALRIVARRAPATRADFAGAGISMAAVGRLLRREARSCGGGRVLWLYRLGPKGRPRRK